jgi:hypothetical protein
MHDRAMSKDKYEGPIELEWENEFPVGVDKVVIENIRHFDRLACPSDLITHHIGLTKDRHGPSVHVYGKKGSDKFHCLYCEKTKWIPWEDVIKATENTPK